MSSMAVLRGEIVESRTPEQWAATVRSDLGHAVAGFIAAGRHLCEAKAQIPHGDWLPWIERELPIGSRMVETLMVVSRHPVLSNSQCVANLPPSVGTLYELSQLDPPQLEAAIQAGKVHPELERKQARALVAQYHKLGAIDERREQHDGPAPRTPKVDVVAQMNRVMLRAEEAARAADPIERRHLAGKEEEVARWARDLRPNIESLTRFLELLDGSVGQDD